MIGLDPNLTFDVDLPRGQGKLTYRLRSCRDWLAYRQAWEKACNESPAHELVDRLVDLAVTELKGAKLTTGELPADPVERRMAIAELFLPGELATFCRRLPESATLAELDAKK